MKVFFKKKSKFVKSHNLLKKTKRFKIQSAGLIELELNLKTKVNNNSSVISTSIAQQPNNIKSLKSYSHLKKQLQKLLERVKSKKKQRNNNFFTERMPNENKCKLINKYFNIDLNINIFITSRPEKEYNYERCFQLLIKENVIIYITFDALNPEFLETPIKEKQMWKQFCTNHTCNFYDLHVEDFRAPTQEILLQFWEILYNFHNNINPNSECKHKCNLLMHCSMGWGRSGFMLMSYIWLMMIIKNPTKYVPLTNEVKEYLKTVEKKLSFIKGDSNEEISKRKKKMLEFISNTLCSMKILIELQDELNKYNSDSVEEIFRSNVDMSELFISRLNVIFITLPLFKRNHSDLFLKDINI